MTDSNGIVGVAKVVAKDAGRAGLAPLSSVIRLFQPAWGNLRLAALEVRAYRDSLSLDQLIQRLVKHVTVGSVTSQPVSARIDTGAAVLSLEAQMRTLRDTAAFLEERKRTRIDFAIAAERHGNKQLRLELFRELRIIEFELAIVQHRLAFMASQQTVRNVPNESATSLRHEPSTITASFTMIESTVK